jgi:TolB protein
MATRASWLGMTVVCACARPPVPPHTAEVASPVPLPEHLDSLEVLRVAWSQDNKWLAFTAAYHNQIDLYVSRADGSQTRRLTDASTFPVPRFSVGQFVVSWLPGDRGVFFVGNHADSVHFYRINADGSALAEYPNPTPPMRTSDGSLSPDGSQIVFTRFVARRHWQLLVRNVDGTNVRELTTASSGVAWNDENPAWSPNGRTIVFDSIRDTTGMGEIYRINADGTDERRLTTNSVNDVLPHWTPDGRHIVWTQVANRHASFFESDPDGGHVRKVVDGFVGTYSPDGKRIAGGGQRGAIGMMPADGSEPQRLVLRGRSP